MAKHSWNERPFVIVMIQDRYDRNCITPQSVSTTRRFAFRQRKSAGQRNYAGLGLLIAALLLIGPLRAQAQDRRSADVGTASASPASGINVLTISQNIRI